jgi:hypothetical protein
VIQAGAKPVIAIAYAYAMGVEYAYTMAQRSPATNCANYLAPRVGGFTQIN